MKLIAELYYHNENQLLCPLSGVATGGHLVFALSLSITPKRKQRPKCEAGSSSGIIIYKGIDPVEGLAGKKTVALLEIEGYQEPLPARKVQVAFYHQGEQRAEVARYATYPFLANQIQTLGRRDSGYQPDVHPHPHSCISCWSRRNIPIGWRPSSNRRTSRQNNLHLSNSNESGS